MAVVVLTATTAAMAGPLLAVLAATAKAAQPATVVLAASAVRTSPVLTVVPIVRPSHAALPAPTAHLKAAVLTARPALTHAPISVASARPGHRNSARRVAVSKAAPTARTVRLLTVPTVLPNPVRTVVHRLSVATTVVAMPPVASVANTVALPVTVVLTATATVVHHTAPSTARTNALKAVVLSRVAISKPVAHRPSVLASKHPVAVHLHAEGC